MMGSVKWIYAIVIGYLAFVKVLGPMYMKNRPAYDLKPILVTFNSLQAIGNLALGLYATKHSYARSDWSLWCQPYMPASENPRHRIYSTVAYFYFGLKLLDLLDTVFFVLRKKSNQISFLHLYHHSMMAITSYYCVRNLVLGHLALMPIINTYVHAIMYTYYLVTCIRPGLKKNLWWKKHITQVQMLQFFILFVHFLRPLVMQDCQYPNFILIMCFMQNALMIYLFANFYRKAYLTKKPLKSS